MSPYDAEPDDSESETPAEESSDSDGKLAGATLRHAILAGDDEAIYEAVCRMVEMHQGHEEPDGDEGPSGEKPNLALLLMKGKKK